MRLTFLVTFILGFCLSSHLSAQITLSDKADIHILTCGPYQGELYSAFGHSAIRVKDPVRKLDLLFNYGVFDFDQPNFYLNFARGYLHYKLDVTDYQRFRYHYVYYNRYIHEQVLNLTQEQKQELFDFLQWNIKPANQYYYYDYFYDNCATRVRDAVKTTFGEGVNFDGGHITTEYTIRELTDLYLQHQPWGDLGIDICLGLPMDKTASPWMYMFLPDYIEQGFANATIRQDSATVPLVKQNIVTYAAKPMAPDKTFFTPLVVFTMVLISGIIISIIGLKKGRRFKGIDILLLIVTGLIGLLLFLLWVATDHKAAAQNMNLLWALPSHLVAGLWLIKNPNARWLKGYFLFSATVTGLTLVLWNFLPQQLHYSLIPLVALLVIRFVINYRWKYEN